MLSGDLAAWMQLSNASNVADIDFEMASLELKNLIIFYEMLLHDRISPLTADQLVQKSYQYPGMICATRKFGNYLKQYSLVTAETFKIRLKALNMLIFIHYPGQMFRKVFGMDRIYKSALTVTQDALNLTNMFSIDLTQMTVLKKRPDAVKSCDPNPMDDERFWKEIFNRVSCLPSYWKKFAPTHLALSTCQTSKEFAKLQIMTKSENILTQIKEKEKILSSLPIPCDEMDLVFNYQMNAKAKQSKIDKFSHSNSTTKSKRSATRENWNNADTPKETTSTKLSKNKKDDSANSAQQNSKTKNSDESNIKATKTSTDVSENEETREKDIVLKITYRMQNYQEIKNEKDFGLESLGSCIGGFVGIFIGYTLLNLLDDFLEFITYFLNPKYSQTKIGNPP